ncbi:MAG: cbb3-type cytochrome c oxidase subunit III CcoP [Roseibaca calidilacus]|uniref:Cbb3-type cytochrome c oxidase subunit n=1 Tax=Roseibaca calidilacus TaxID=1666912 RepID=A0A0P8AI04_9RHOB|nr:cytochrome-c oxidase, cbb3-type subunit III [Roseibaca calidilacus]KPP93964.1 MAG: cbb3-type cytochrome c oxidase subunit III CcoP [Roseibaca calidilacus]CUX79490.1 cytochrome c oxidase cbb3-type subunit 3 [Roseibaca calidilacus]
MADNSKKSANHQKGDPNTTGHSWDGIEEFDNPMPRWWVWIFILCVIWSFGYWVAFPAWPGISKATSGVLGYSSRGDVADEIAQFESRHDALFAQILETEPADLADNEDLHRFAVNAGASVFAAQCSQCHGAGGAGVQAGGFPNLLDDDWLWGGTKDDIVQTVAYGIRNEDYPDARYSEMPAFGRDELLSEEEIQQATHFVLSLSGSDHDAELASAGAEVYDYNCSSCHGVEGNGDPFMGAPALNDQIWLYGGSEETIYESIYSSRFGVMPGFDGRLREAEIRAVAAYVHQLGGGE